MREKVHSKQRVATLMRASDATYYLLTDAVHALLFQSYLLSINANKHTHVMSNEENALLYKLALV